MAEQPVNEGTSPCPQCGSKLRAGVRFCEHCGFDTEGSAAGATGAPGNPCPTCGSANRVGVQFCETCGSNLPSEIVPAAQPAAAGAAVPGAASRRRHWPGRVAAIAAATLAVVATAAFAAEQAGYLDVAAWISDTTITSGTGSEPAVSMVPAAYYSSPVMLSDGTEVELGLRGGRDVAQTGTVRPQASGEPISEQVVPASLLTSQRYLPATLQQVANTTGMELSYEIEYVADPDPQSSGLVLDVVPAPGEPLVAGQPLLFRVAGYDVPEVAADDIEVEVRAEVTPAANPARMPLVVAMWEKDFDATIKQLVNDTDVNYLVIERTTVTVRDFAWAGRVVEADPEPFAELVDGALIRVSIGRWQPEILPPEPVFAPVELEPLEFAGFCDGDADCDGLSNEAELFFARQYFPVFEFSAREAEICRLADESDNGTDIDFRCDDVDVAGRVKHPYQVTPVVIDRVGPGQAGVLITIVALYRWDWIDTAAIGSIPKRRGAQLLPDGIGQQRTWHAGDSERVRILVGIDCYEVPGESPQDEAARYRECRESRTGEIMGIELKRHDEIVIDACGEIACDFNLFDGSQPHLYVSSGKHATYSDRGECEAVVVFGLSEQCGEVLVAGGGPLKPLEYHAVVGAELNVGEWHHPLFTDTGQRSALSGLFVNGEPVWDPEGFVYDADTQQQKAIGAFCGGMPVQNRTGSRTAAGRVMADGNVDDIGPGINKVIGLFDFIPGVSKLADNVPICAGGLFKMWFPKLDRRDAALPALEQSGYFGKTNSLGGPLIRSSTGGETRINCEWCFHKAPLPSDEPVVPESPDPGPESLAKLQADVNAICAAGAPELVAIVQEGRESSTLADQTLFVAKVNQLWLSELAQFGSLRPPPDAPDDVRRAHAELLRVYQEEIDNMAAIIDAGNGGSRSDFDRLVGTGDASTLEHAEVLSKYGFTCLFASLHG